MLYLTMLYVIGYLFMGLVFNITFVLGIGELKVAHLPKFVAAFLVWPVFVLIIALIFIDDLTDSDRVLWKKKPGEKL